MNCLSGEVVSLLCIWPGAWCDYGVHTLGLFLAVWSRIPSVKFVVDPLDRRSCSAECIVDQHINIFTAQRPISGHIWWLWHITRYVMDVYLLHQKHLMSALKSDVNAAVMDSR